MKAVSTLLVIALGVLLPNLAFSQKWEKRLEIKYPELEVPSTPVYFSQLAVDGDNVSLFGRWREVSQKGQEIEIKIYPRNGAEEIVFTGDAVHEHAISVVDDQIFSIGNIEFFGNGNIALYKELHGEGYALINAGTSDLPLIRKIDNSGNFSGFGADFVESFTDDFYVYSVIESSNNHILIVGEFDSFTGSNTIDLEADPLVQGGTDCVLLDAVDNSVERLFLPDSSMYPWYLGENENSVFMLNDDRSEAYKYADGLWSSFSLPSLPAGESLINSFVVNEDSVFIITTDESDPTNAIKFFLAGANDLSWNQVILLENPYDYEDNDLVSFEYHEGMIWLHGGFSRINQEDLSPCSDPKTCFTALNLVSGSVETIQLDEYLATSLDFFSEGGDLFINIQTWFGSTLYLLKDSVPPLAPVIAGMSGGVNANDITDFGTVVYEGGLIIEYYVDGEENIITPNVNGTWSFSSSDLTDGVHSRYAIAKDKDGNKSSSSDTLSIRVDTKIDAPQIVTNATVYRGYTSMIDVTVTEIATVYLYENDVSLGGITTSGEASFSVEMDSVGTFYYYVIATDLVGNSATSDTINVSVTDVLPTPILTQEFQDSVLILGDTIFYEMYSGFGTHGVFIVGGVSSVVPISNDSSASISVVAQTTDTTFVVGYVFDSFGNESYTTEVMFFVATDTLPVPVFTALFDVDTLLLGDTASYRVNSSVGDSATFLVNGVSETSLLIDGEVTFSVVCDTAGVYNVSAFVSDSFGNKSDTTSTHTFVVEEEEDLSPIIKNLYPQDEIFSPEDTVTFLIETDNTELVIIYLDAISPDSIKLQVKNGMASYIMKASTIGEGSHSFSVVAVGNNIRSEPVQSQFKIEESSSEPLGLPADLEFNVYPNPILSGENLTIEGVGIVLSVSDMNGKDFPVNQKLESSVSLPMDFSTGMYLVKIRTSSGGISTKKIFVK